MGPVTAVVPYRGAPSFRPMAEDTGGARPATATSPKPPVPVRPDRPDTLARLQRRPSAAFLAHLIATTRNLPQTRERRRAEPDTAIGAYAAIARLVPRA